MAPKYNDDEMIVGVVHHIDEDAYPGGKTTARYANKPDAPKTKTDFKVLMELTGTEDAKERPGLDLVMVLDVSGSMTKKDRIGHLKTASKFVVKKLSPLDRLSVIKFSTHAQRLCPLRQMTLDAQSEIEELITKLHHEGRTNMTEALEEALQVLNDRQLREGRQVAIMFMSDGRPNPKEADGTLAHIEDVPVYTFGLGEDTDHEILQKMASRSKLGTFSTIKDVEGDNNEISNLSIAFSQCLAGLLSVVVEDLALTVTPQGNSTIKDVLARRYRPNEIKPDKPVTISFGNLYSKEIRNILVDLVLDEVTESKGTDVLKFTYSYKDPVTGKPYNSLPFKIAVSRNDFSSAKEDPEVLMELARQNTAARIKQAREKADVENYDGAKATLNDGQTDLQKLDVDKSDPKMKALQSELAQFLKYLETPETYKKLGRAFALAAELSHALQRFAARGDPNELLLFATDNMINVAEQVKEYAKDPVGYKVPTPAEDAVKVKQANDEAKNRNAEDAVKVKQANDEAKNRNGDDDDPVKSIVHALSMHIGQAIQSLHAVLTNCFSFLPIGSS